jgi:hypothetical protein
MSGANLPYLKAQSILVHINPLQQNKSAIKWHNKGRQAGRQDGRQAGRRLGGRLGGRLAGRLAGWQAGRLAGWLDGWMAGWQAWQQARQARSKDLPTLSANIFEAATNRTTLSLHSLQDRR